MTAERTLLYLVTEDWFFASHWLPIARAARDAGWRVVVATRVEAHGEAIAAEGFELVPLAWRRGPVSPVALAREVLAVTRLYRRVRPDLVHHISLKPILVGGLAARLSRIQPVVNAITGFGYSVGGDGEASNRTRARLFRILPFVTRRPGSLMVFENGDDMAVAVSAGIADARRTEVIRGAGVDTKHFRPLLEPDSDHVTVGYCGRMLAQKGVQDLVEAVHLARRRNPGLRLLMAGKSDPGNPGSLAEATLEAMATDPAVDWLGHLPDVRDLWRRVDIACVPSRGGEGVPKALLEAGACGRPVVATDVPGCREVVVDGKTGVMVPPRDPEALAGALADLAENAERRRAYAVAIRDKVEAEFAEPAIVGAMLAVYDRAVAADQNGWA